jgi:U6 snRNA-associated Sm-like protein LSm7
VEKPKREAILDLSKYVNERIRVKFTGGREGTRKQAPRKERAQPFRLLSVTGVLKGYDQLLNLVLDEVEEHLQGSWTFAHIRDFPDCKHHFSEPEGAARTLGLVVLRGPTITLLCPVDGLEEISNPFIPQD